MSGRQAPADRSLARVFAMPAAIGAVSGFGLIAALLGDEAWDAASWLALAVPPALVLRHAPGTRPRER
jgi:hypothetical protein